MAIVTMQKDANRDAGKLIDRVKNSRECAKLSLELVESGKPKEGYQVLLEGMKRFEGIKPSLLPLYIQYQRGHISEQIREQEERGQYAKDTQRKKVKRN